MSETELPPVPTGRSPAARFIYGKRVGGVHGSTGYALQLIPMDHAAGWIEFNPVKDGGDEHRPRFAIGADHIHQLIADLHQAEVELRLADASEAAWRLRTAERERDDDRP